MTTSTAPYRGKHKLILFGVGVSTGLVAAITLFLIL